MASISHRQHGSRQHLSHHQHGGSQRALVDPREQYELKKRNTTLLAALATIHSQCLSVKERQNTARQLHSRLNQVFLRATNAAASGASDQRNRAILNHPRRVAAFTALVDALHVTLKRHVKLKANIVRRVLHHRVFSLQLRSIHHQLTAFLKDAGADNGFPYDWRDVFEKALREDENILHETLATVVRSSSFLSKEYLTLSPHQQMEVLMNVRSERLQSIDLSTVLDDCLKLIYRALVRLFGWDLTETARHIPRWFTPMTSVDFSTSRDLLTKLKPTYRGEIAITERGGLKRHLIVMKCCTGDAKSDVFVDEKIEIMDAFIAKYGAIHHSNVLLVRGANYVASAPFITRDYATQGTLLGHVARLRHSLGRKDQFDESIIWRLLADACEGLLFIHEHGYATHGGLKASNLLVNHRGRACVADSGMRVLRARLDASTTRDEHEYVRWLAPEFMEPSLRAQTSMLADVYAFGMCILEVLTGQPPWGHVDCAKIEELKLANDTALPAPPRGVLKREWRLIQKMCAPDPIARLPLRQVYTALLELSRGTVGDVVPASIRIDTATTTFVKDVASTPFGKSVEREEEPSEPEEEEANDLASLAVANNDSFKSASESLDPADGPQKSVQHPPKPEEESDTQDEANEFETESVSSFKTTVELSDDVDYSLPTCPHNADSTYVLGQEEEEEEEDNDKAEEEEEDDEDEEVHTFQDLDVDLPVDTFDAFNGHQSTNVGLTLQTNGQMKNAIDFLAECHDSPPQALLPHLQLLCAFAKEEAESIRDCGGVRVLNALFMHHTDAKIRSTTLEIYTTMLLAGRQSVADSLVDQGLVALVFDYFTAPTTSADEINICVGLLLDLMVQSDQAKRQIGDAEKKYVEILEKNENVHHRLLSEIKSVLARYKQAEGNEMLKEGFHVLAVQRFTEAIQLDRRRGIYYADRSLAYCHGRRFHEAAEDAERCIRYNPFDAQGYLRYGIAMKHLRKYTEALASLRKGYQVNPNHTQLTAVMDEVQKLYNQQKAR